MIIDPAPEIINNETVGEVVSYEQPLSNGVINDRYVPQRFRDEEKNVGEHHKKRIASCIVSPALRQPTLDENVTIRNKSLTWSLSYSLPDNALENEQIIGALNGMELMEPFEDEAM